MSDIEVEINEGPANLPSCAKGLMLRQDNDTIVLDFDDEAWLELILQERRVGRDKRAVAGDNATVAAKLVTVFDELRQAMDREEGRAG